MKLLIVVVAYFIFQLVSSSSINIYDKNSIEKTLNYWTKERMQKAEPFGLLSINEKGQWDGKLVKEANFKQPNNTKFVPEASLDKTPYKETGKVFFKMNGKGYVCSGASLVKNVVITAGHCMVFFGNWHKEWIFVPRYRDGEAPLGKWPAIKGLVHDRWRKLNDAARDVAFAIVSKQDGKSISQVVGALGFASNRGFNVNAIGYPVRNWGGERMVHTSTTVKYTDMQKKPPTQGIDSQLTPGCSGGPWFAGNRFGKGVFGVNSYTKNKGDIYSPTFDHEIIRIYQQAAKE